MQVGRMWKCIDSWPIWPIQKTDQLTHRPIVYSADYIYGMNSSFWKCVPVHTQMAFLYSRVLQENKNSKETLALMVNALGEKVGGSDHVFVYVCGYVWSADLYTEHQLIALIKNCNRSSGILWYSIFLSFVMHLWFMFHLVIKKVKVAHTRLPSVGFRSWSRFLAVSLKVTWVINPAVGCHYFPPGLQLPPPPLRGLLPILLLGE